LEKKVSHLTHLILVRHAETAANQEFRYSGVQDDPLSAHGLEQAEYLAKRLATLPIVAVYSSLLRRAHDTASRIATPHDLAVHDVEWLRECNFGPWEGLSRAEIIALSSDDAKRLLAWERDPTIAAPSGESLKMLQARVCTNIAPLVRTHAADTILLVSHVGPIKALLCAVLGAPLTTMFKIFLDTATVSVVDWSNGRWLVRLVNDNVHLGWTQSWWKTSTAAYDEIK